MARPSLTNPLGYVLDRQYNDSVVIKNRLFKERLARAKNLYRKDLLAHYGCVNAIEFSDEGELLISGGDDRRVLLWSVPDAIYGKGTPMAMQTTHISNIFCLAFDSMNSKIFSGGNDDQVIVHDAGTGNFVVKLLHKKPVYGLSVNPQNDYVIATAGDDGRILIYDIREPTTEPLCAAKQKTGFHSVMFNPFNPRLLATANSEEGIALWDYRKPKEQLIHYDSDAVVSGISVCFNSTGTRLLALRRRLPPVLYATQSQRDICQFYHPQYYNSCTMKTCCFAGDNDEYVLSGSDDFNLYMWRVPKDDSEWGKTHLVLRGHRSIVNQVRYNKNNNLIASSGVEKMVKLWSTLPVGTWEGSLSKECADAPRAVYSHDDYIYLVGHSGQRISHDYSDQSTQEDSRMMAFFDSLIQREIEGWDSPSDSYLTSSSDSDESTQERIRLSWESLLNKRLSEEGSKKHKPNRIAQLIAQKRDRLAKMAQRKSSSSVYRYDSREKRRKRKTSQKLKSPNSNHKYTKSNGISFKKTSSKRGQTSSASFQGQERSSRKHKLSPDVPEKWNKSKKYRTRQSVKDTYESSTSNNSFDAPSTSTGITRSNSSIYRVIEQDSDEDVVPNQCVENQSNSEENFVNILPTPLNGTHDMYINVLETNNGSSNGNVVTLRNENYVTSPHASTSSSSINIAPGVSRNICSVDSLPYVGTCNDGEDYNDSYESYVNNGESYVSESDSDCEYDITPIKKNRSCDLDTPDSGFVTGPCSSNSAYSIRSARNHPACSSWSNGSSNNRSSDDTDFPHESFRKRIKKARINIRKQVGGDSDSN